MAADGQVLIDTKMNTDGIETGTDKVRQSMDRMAVALKNANKDVLEFMDNYEKGLTGSAGKTNEFKQELNSLEKQLKDMEGRGLYFGDEEYDDAYLKLQKAEQVLKDYKKELTSPTPNANPFGLDTISGKVLNLEMQLRKLIEAGKGLGDEKYDKLYHDLAVAKGLLLFLYGA